MNDAGALRPGDLHGVTTSPLQRYLKMASRFAWLIGAAALAGLLLALLVTLSIDKRYSASVDLEISREDANVVNIQGVQPESGSLDQEFYQTQYGLLESRTLAERVATVLRLTENTSFLASHDIVEEQMFGDQQALPTDRESRNERLKLVTETLLDNVEVVPERASRLVTVTYTDLDPALAARIANTWAEAYIQTNLERRFEASAYARDFLEEQLAQTRTRLNQSERELVDYAARQGIIRLDADGEDPERRSSRSIVTDDLRTLNAALAQAQTARIAAEAAYREAAESRGGASRGALENVGISTLRRQKAELEAEVARLESLFGPEYPQLTAAQAQLREMEATISREEARVVQSLQDEFAAARSAESEIQRRVDQLKDDVIDQRRRGIQYQILQREVDTNRELYDGLLQRYKEVGIAAGVGTNNVAIVDEARVPEEPSGPRLLLNLFLGLIGGTALGVALSFAFDQIDETISDPTTVRDATGLSLLGTVPATEGDEVIEALGDIKSDATEAYLSIATGLRFATEHGFPKAIAVTSSRPAEGKSTTSFALALTQARQGERTIIVDLDMRSPSLHHLVDRKNEIGVSNYLIGEDVLSMAVQSTEIPNLSVLFAGPQPPNAADLLSGNGLTNLMNDLLQTHNHIVFDAPPILGLADAPLIVSKIEDVVMVVEAHKTPLRVLRNALARLDGTGARLLGAVLTKLKQSKSSYGYDYTYTYGERADVS